MSKIAAVFAGLAVGAAWFISPYVKEAQHHPAPAEVGVAEPVANLFLPKFLLLIFITREEGSTILEERYSSLDECKEAGMRAIKRHKTALQSARYVCSQV